MRSTFLMILSLALGDSASTPSKKVPRPAYIGCYEQQVMTEYYNVQNKHECLKWCLDEEYDYFGISSTEHCLCVQSLDELELLPEPLDEYYDGSLPDESDEYYDGSLPDESDDYETDDGSVSEECDSVAVYHII